MSVDDHLSFDVLNSHISNSGSRECHSQRAICSTTSGKLLRRLFRLYSDAYRTYLDKLDSHFVFHGVIPSPHERIAGEPCIACMWKQTAKYLVVSVKAINLESYTSVKIQSKQTEPQNRTVVFVFIWITKVNDCYMVYTYTCCFPSLGFLYYLSLSVWLQA